MAIITKGTPWQQFVIQFCIIVILLSIGAHAGSDWMQQCSVCHCKWNSGKKMADCKNSSIMVIPTDMSSEMQVLDLSHNQIAEIHRDEFKDANLENLHKIFMRNCTLQEINRDALKGLQVLIELDFSNNQVRVLHPGTFTGLLKLRTLIMNNNLVEKLEDNLFEDLSFLNKLEFKHNRIFQIGLQTFVNVPKLNHIFLEFNRLSVLKEDTFKDLGTLLSLSLSENPWNCTCELQQFQKFVLNMNLYTPPTSCEEPQHLRGKLWSDIPADNFACKPKIISPMAGAAVDATSENVTLICRIRGSPKPDIMWLYNKKQIHFNDPRVYVKNSQEMSRRDSSDVLTSELTLIGVKTVDRGTYTCSASNKGGKDEADIVLSIPSQNVNPGAVVTSTSNWLLLICLIAIAFLIILIIIALGIWCYCRRIKKYSKNGSISENGLVPGKSDKTQVSDSMLEGSVIMEMQKSLLTEVNPVEKPPRRTELGSAGDLVEDGHELKKTLLDETNFGIPEDETHSISLSDTTPRSRTTYIDDGYGTNLPPDLLAFSARFPQSPSLQSSMSNIQDGRLYIKSPVASPIYQHTPSIYTAQPNPGFRTLQHPKIGRNLSMAPRSNSPFTPAPVLYTPVVMKQGYVTIPRKPRTPSWAPSLSSNLTDFPPTSPTSTLSSELAEPVYDNLGLRTTASGNSVLSLNKTGLTPVNAVKYSMKDRPLPATPRPYDTIQEANQPISLDQSINDDTQALYIKSNSRTPIIVNGNGTTDKVAKIPPRPPPKPKKKRTGGTTGDQGSTSQLFEDEGEDGTEV